MAEELVLNVRSNIASITQEVKDLNNTLAEQRKILIELKQEELRLQTERSKMSAYERGLTGIDKKIEHVTLAIKDQSLAVKGLTQEQRESNRKLKEANKELKEQESVMDGTIGNFQIFGVSLNGVKKTIGGIIPLIKLMFKSIYTGIASTGIGVLLLAFGSLVTYLTSTKEGMDKLNVVIAKVSALFKVIKDRISTFGSALLKVFSGDMTGAIKDFQKATASVGDEIAREVKLAGELEKANQKLRDAENDFMLQKAQTRKEIEKARLLAEDETKSAEERLEALEKALKLEQQTTDQEVKMAKERLRIFETDMKQSKHKAEDEKKLAELKADVVNREIKSLRMQKRVMTEVNEMQNQIASEAKRRADERQKQLDEEAAKLQELIDLEKGRVNDLTKDAAKLLDEHYERQISAQQREERAVFDKYFAIIEGKKALGEDVAELEEAQQSEIDAINEKYAKTQIARDKAVLDAKKGIAKDGLRLISEVAGQGSTIGKAAAVASATISGVEGVQNAFTTAQDSPITALMPAYPYIQAGLAGAFNAVQIQKILSGSPADSAGGGGMGGGNPAIVQQSPAPQTMGGAFELTGGVRPEPVKAFVVSDDITNNQDKLANIRRRATI
jgi:hypothetical protein